MSTAIPAFVSQFIPTAETVQVTSPSGTPEPVPTDHWYYLVSNRVAGGAGKLGNGQSLLFALKTLLEASLAGTAWTVVLTKVGATYRIQLSHNNGSSRTVTFSADFATKLGFSSASFAVASATTVTAAYPSVWWWTPDMPISLTGPKLFDPSISFGVPESAGASQRAPDMTAAYVRNGTQWSAEYTFSMVQGLYMVRDQAGTYTNRSLETWWINGPQLGRRFLMWRNRDNATGSNAPSEGSASPWNYIEYNPQDTLRGTFPADATQPPNLYNWDVKLDCWLTENVDTPLAD